ncbi:MAG: SdrD B-like domain-containing protein [Aristaeellaceae bacterium]
MVNKRSIAKGAVLMLCAVLAHGQTATAEEKHVGDYIYVPAMQVASAAGAFSLRVEGLALEAGSDEAQVVDALAGAEFGVYVFSGTGELTPWANPLYPSEPMRIRTGDGETRFTLPQGTEFYLRQESAPQGYLFDDETLIPVTGEEIVVQNAMAGQLAVSAVDSLGVPVAGVVLEATGEDGERRTMTTDENGEAVLVCEQAQRYTVREIELPEGTFAARSVSGGETVQDGVAVSVSIASRSRVTFEHPAAGSVLLDMQLTVIDDNAQTAVQPLEGVRMDIFSDPAISVVTDAQGQARASLLEGTYGVRLSYEGSGDVILPVSEGQMIVESGSTTVIELSAHEATGRMVWTADCEQALSSGSVTLTSESTGKVYGPYALDAEGMAVSEALPADTYRMTGLTIDEGVQLGEAACGGVSAHAAGDLLLEVSAGQVTQVHLQLLTREKQTFSLAIEHLNEQGEIDQETMGEALTLTLLDAHGEAAAQIEAAQGMAAVDALSGEYTLSMTEHDAARLGVQPVSRVFALPSAQETIVFASDRARVILCSVDENGASAAGAVYQLTDSTGARFEVACDEDGMAVSPLLTPGEVRVETLDAPQGHAGAAAQTVTAEAGEAVRAEVVHERYGSAALTVRMQSLNETGGLVYAPVAGVQVDILRAEANGTLTETGTYLTTDENGQVNVSLPAGEYAAVMDEQALALGCRAPEAVRFAVENTKQTEAALTCLSDKGGVRVRLTGGSLQAEELAQIRFELIDADGTVIGMTMQDGAFYAGGLAAGEYVLRQTQMPSGYTLSGDRTVDAAGGEVTEISMPLEEYAVVTVSKTGLTFDSAMRTYVVPLTGQYGVYTMEDGEMKPYPSVDSPMTLWANVTVQEMAEGKNASAKLPAAVEGTVYYLHELGSAEGFAADETYYEVLLRAGEMTTLDCAVSSDRGFFTLDVVDAATGAHVPGGSYELVSRESGEAVLTFEMGEAAYQNPMAVPVGAYVLRQIKAAAGYALSVPVQIDVQVEPYLTQGGQVTAVQMAAVQVPQNGELNLIEAIYAAQQQDLTLLCVETGALEGAQTLLAPSLTIETGAAGSERSDIASVVLSGAGDAVGGTYRARVEYCLDGGGWQPSDARETGVLSGPTAVSLDDVHDDISAVRVTYISDATGREEAGAGFTPGQVTLSVEASAQGSVNMTASSAFTGVFAYQTELNGQTQMITRSAQADCAFVMQAGGLFDTVSAGRDGRITGMAFFDEDADGVMDAQETSRYAGMTVSLQTISGDVVATTRTGADGRYAFDAISSGEYKVEFDAGEGVVFSSGSLQSAHLISGIEDMRYGTSGTLRIDGGHTDYVVNVGCLYAAEIGGVVLERVDDGETTGFVGLNVEMRSLSAGADDEPIVVVTGGMGEFAFSRILPGTYEVTIEVPQDYLCQDAADGKIVKTIELSAGDVYAFGVIELEKSAAICGTVRVDEDGDGVIAEGARTLSGVRVALLRASEGHTETIDETVTDENGAYAFEALHAGEYSVLFELSGDWAFTRYGEDSQVYGAVSQSGATRTIALNPGETARAVDAGVTIPAKLTVTVFCDTQYDGQKGTYEELLSGATVSLIRLENGEDAEEIALTTDVSGTTTFDGVSPGEYVLAYQLPGQWRSTKQIDAVNASYPVSCVPQSASSSGRSLPFTLSMGDDEKRYIGAMLSGSISGVAFYDDDADANTDEGEEGCPDMLVELVGQDGETAAQMRTGEDGSYQFEGLAPGRYTVRFTAQEGCGFSGTERTVTRGGVQQSDTNVSSTRAISVVSGQATSTANAGVVRLSSLSGFIWEDSNGDRVPNEGETPMSGVSVHLMDGAGRNILQSTETDAAGGFAFERLKPGTYKLRVDARSSYVFSGAQEGGALALETERDGRGYSPAFTLLGGVQVQNIGYGLLTQGTISGLVWEDSDFDGVMGGSESGLRGATVTLLDDNGSEVASRQTIRSGEFTFDQLMPGQYALRVTLPDGYQYTAEGSESLAPRTGLADAEIALGELEMGGTMADVRIGALKTAALGGVVWFDQDDDGKRANEETGMAGVRVTFTMTSGADAGRVQETVTDETGAYRFDGVTPGDAVLTFTLDDGYAFARQAVGTRRVSSVPMENANTASTASLTIAAGDSRTDIDVGVVGVGTVSGVVWEDSAYDGKVNDDERGVSGALVELVNAATGETADSAETDENGGYEIGFVRKGEYALRVTLPGGRIFTRSGESLISEVDADTAQTDAFALAMGESREDLRVGTIVPACITGRVAIDRNGDGTCGEDEPGLEGAVVTAMQGGTVVATAHADQTGAFSFDLLRPGTYRLRYVLGEDAFFALGAPLNMTDADAMEGETGEVTLAMGEAAQAGAVPVVLAGRIAGRAFEDANVNGAMDADEAAMTDVKAELLDANGAVLAKTQVDEEGRYAFERLREGVYSVRFTLDSTMLFTDFTGREGDSAVPVVDGYVGVTNAFALAMGEDKENLNVGGILPGRIGDTVWHDKDGNGLQDYKEPLIPGVQLTLLTVHEDGTMTEAAATSSDKYGYYAFDALRPGTYVLRLDAREGDTLTSCFGAPLGEIDSDIDPDTGMSAPILLQSGQTLLNIDVGLTDYAR